jgi:membrane-associated phospholipid phosphatase
MPNLDQPPSPPALAPTRPTTLLIALRILLVCAGLAAWFATQAMLGARAPDDRFIGDRLLDLLQPANQWLHRDTAARNVLLIISSALIDLLGLFMLGKSICGKTLRPFVGLVMLFGLRQIIQSICVLAPPPEMIWPKDGPGFPSLLVTYSVGNDMFFSGHTALAVYGAVELARLRKWLIPVGLAIALFEVTAVLMLRAHWTMDVYAGAVTALLVAFLADYITQPIDRALARLFHRPAAT